MGTRGIQAPEIARIGHNGGPPLYPRDGTYHMWRKARRKAFRGVPHATMMRRARRAAELGLTYEELTLEILERGRYLSAADGERVAEIIAARGCRAGRGASEQDGQ